MEDDDLRDLFAGLVMMGIACRGLHEAVIHDAAKDAYLVADAMVAAKYRSKEPEDGIASVVKKRKPKD